MRLIDAEKLCELARNHTTKSVDCNDIMRLPTADVNDVRHANWIDILEYSVYISDMKTSIELTEQKCSNCYCVTTFKGNKLYLPDFYCPNCGAKMELGGYKKDELEI